MIDVFLWIMLILQVYNIHFPSFYELIELSIVVCTMLNLEVSIE